MRFDFINAKATIPSATILNTSLAKEPSAFEER